MTGVLFGVALGFTIGGCITVARRRPVRAVVLWLASTAICVIVLAT